MIVENLFGEVKQTHLLKQASGSTNKTAPNVPYMGNKAAITEYLVYIFPKCKHFLDACCGGGSVGYSMLAHGRAESVTMNDIYTPLIDLHKSLQSGDHDIDFEFPKWVSREAFFYSLDRIDAGNYTPMDVANKYCWSFGNSGSHYMFGNDKKMVKQAAHEMVCGKTIKERRRAYKKFMRLLPEILANGNELENERGLEQLERLQQLERLDFMNKDIYEIDYTKYDCVYFDIPYKDTKKYEQNFNYEKFWNFFMSLPILAFASEYKAPDFVPLVKSINKRVLLSVKTQGVSGMQIGKEKIYCNDRSFKLYQD